MAYRQNRTAAYPWTMYQTARDVRAAAAPIYGMRRNQTAFAEPWWLGGQRFVEPMRNIPGVSGLGWSLFGGAIEEGKDLATNLKIGVWILGAVVAGYASGWLTRELKRRT